MALSFKTVQEAYTIFNELQRTVVPELDIRSYPADMSQWSWEKKDNPPVLQVLGWDRKSDDGWENLFFFVEDPSIELKHKFDELNSIKGNTSMFKKYKDNSDLWIIGWI